MVCYILALAFAANKDFKISKKWSHKQQQMGVALPAHIICFLLIYSAYLARHAQ
jgi:hypothetical protein